MIRKKALYKTITWRLISTGQAFLLSLIFLGDLKLASQFTVTHAIIGSVLYYLHEELYRWLRKIGKI